MSNQTYGYNPSSYGGVGGAAAIYASRTLTDPYYPDSSSSSFSSSRYFTTPSDPQTIHPDSHSSSHYSSMYMNPNMYSNDITGAYSSGRLSAPGVPTSTTATMTPPLSHNPSWSSWPGGFDVGAASGYDPLYAGVKRPTEALYHQNYLGTNYPFGQSEALFSANILGKRPRFESASSLPIYPQRPGEKDCAHYMLTRTCKYGDTCKFDHPIWVPEGGLPDWKEVMQVPLAPTSESLPERPGEPDCPYFLKTQKCKFGLRCRFNHPKDKIVSTDGFEAVELPERPSEPACPFYMKTGKCKFGAGCKFHHPKDIQIPVVGQENGNLEETHSVALDGGTIADAMSGKPYIPLTPALMHNSKGLPVRPGEVDCPFYLKTGSCKYGSTCRYSHPDRYAINPTVAALGHTVIASPTANMNMGLVHSAASMLPTIDPRLAQPSLGLSSGIYPQRPGQMECDFYMKTGICKFGERCRFHHPIDRSAPTPTMTKQALQQNLKLTLAGLPRREGSIVCPFYMKTGTCKYGVNCRFDHPPPGEAVAMATEVQGVNPAAGEGKEDNKADANQIQEQQQP